MLPLSKRALKEADRFLGPWLASIAHVFRPIAVKQKNDIQPSFISAALVKRILVIRPGGLGDAVLTFPMIQALHDHFKGAFVDVLAESRNADIYTINHQVKKVYRYDERLPATMRCLFNGRYDLIVDTEQFHDLSTLFALILRPTYLCGFASPTRVKFLTHPVPYRHDMYEALSFLNLAASVTGKKISLKVEEKFLEIPHPFQDWACSILGPDKDRPTITVMPSATASERVWPTEKYGQILHWLVKKGYRPLIVGGPDAIHIAKRLTSKFEQHEVFNFAGRTSIVETAALIQRSHAHLSSDTGVLHLAYGLGTPTVSLFGSGLYKKWAPVGHRHRMIRAEMECSPCVRNGEIPPCPNKGACMKAITVKQVKKALQEVLGA